MMIYKFEISYYATEATKNICCAKSDGVVDHWMVKKFCLGCKNLDDQARSDKPKTMDSKAMFQAREANLVSK